MPQPAKPLLGINVEELNRFIQEMAKPVFVFWLRFMNIELSEIDKEVRH